VLPAAGILDGSTMLVRRFGRLGRQVLRAPPKASVSWRREILPLQWRVGLQGLLGYFQFNLFNPVMFHHHGPVVAGQMGMTLAMTAVLTRIGFAWVEAHVPRMGVHVARRDYAALDVLFSRAVRVSLALVAAGASALVVGVWILERAGVPFAARLLPPAPTALFALGVVAMHLSSSRAAYLRAHNREPLLLVGVVGACLTGALVWLLGARFGPTGAAGGALAVSLCWVWPGVALIYRRARREWHA
jgi:hypothetical protein